jgi:MYND finger
VPAWLESTEGAACKRKPRNIFYQRLALECGLYAEKGSDEATTWIYLAAAQGVPAAEGVLGGLCCETKSCFGAIYWLRKAALQDDPQSQDLLCTCLLKAKMVAYDDGMNPVGSSCFPEFVFWQDLYIKTMKRFGRPDDDSPMDHWYEQCGCCEKTVGEDGGSLKRCVNCKSIAYCDRDCQVKHWKMGHKSDCKSIDKYKRLMKDE